MSRIGIFSKDKFLRSQQIEPFLFACMLFFMTPPFFLWNKISPLVFVAICCSLTLINLQIEKSKIILFFSLIFFYLFVAYKDNTNINGILSLFGICTLALNSDSFIKDVFKKYVFIFSLTLIPSIISFLLVYVGSIKLPFSYIDSLNIFKSYNYIHYPFFVQENKISEIVLPRFHAYYDEPGVVGTISGILLFLNRFNLKEKINIPIFIAGVLSFSFAFYVIMVIYVLLFLKMKYKILVILLIAGLFPLLSSNEMLNTYILSRFQVENGQFVGDNRIAGGGFEYFYNNYLHSENVYFGLGSRANLKVNFGGASYKDLILNYGIIPFISFVLIFISFAYLKFKWKKEFFIFLIIMVAVLYQRPFITNYFYVFLIYAPISVLIGENSKKEGNVVRFEN
jgi:hypothetical protein